MTMQTVHTVGFLALLIAAEIAQSKTASQVMYQNLEDALIADRNLIKLAFFSSQTLYQDIVYLNICVTVDLLQPGSCGNSSLPSNFSYCQKFQWSSSALVDFISFDQLVIMDNVVSESVFQNMMHRKYFDFPIKLDSLSICITKDDILAAIMQLLPWVCILYYYTSIVVAIMMTN